MADVVAGASPGASAGSSSQIRSSTGAPYTGTTRLGSQMIIPAVESRTSSSPSQARSRVWSGWKRSSPNAEKMCRIMGSAMV